MSSRTHGRRRLPGAAVLLCLLLLAMPLAAACAAPTSPRSPGRRAPPARSKAPPPASSQRKPATPVAIEVPSAGIVARVVPVGTTAGGAMAVTKDPKVADWFAKGPRPGERGSAVIAGHAGYARTSAAFDPLPRVRVGDPVYVRGADGGRMTFKVVSERAYPAAANVPEVFGREDGRYLNLVTCTGSWDAAAGTHSKRLVVFTRLVE